MVTERGLMIAAFVVAIGKKRADRHRALDLWIDYGPTSRRANVTLDPFSYPVDRERRRTRQQRPDRFEIINIASQTR